MPVFWFSKKKGSLVRPLIVSLLRKNNQLKNLKREFLFVAFFRMTQISLRLAESGYCQCVSCGPHSPEKEISPSFLPFFLPVNFVVLNVFGGRPPNKGAFIPSSFLEGLT